jgi:hypothetical protein
LPIKPNTRIKINGKKIENTTVEGLRMIALKLALDIASIALNWLYCWDIHFNWPQK